MNVQEIYDELVIPVYESWCTERGYIFFDEYPTDYKEFVSHLHEFNQQNRWNLYPYNGKWLRFVIEDMDSITYRSFTDTELADMAQKAVLVIAEHKAFHKMNGKLYGAVLVTCSFLVGLFAKSIASDIVPFLSEIVGIGLFIATLLIGGFIYNTNRPELDDSVFCNW
ncbi:hypothetical protein [Pseudodesulfovibrio sp.]|uniref:hypothetical protein n=1 Tax=unclassified Pseudodesulfovibrio TaxID=2661612 RepID=UPI003AFF85AB